MAGTDITIAERVAQSRAAQGLPPKITDPRIIARIAAVALPRGGGQRG